jgi:hypothetical protein
MFSRFFLPAFLGTGTIFTITSSVGNKRKAVMLCCCAKPAHRRSDPSALFTNSSNRLSEPLLESDPFSNNPTKEIDPIYGSDLIEGHGTTKNPTTDVELTELSNTNDQVNIFTGQNFSSEEQRPSSSDMPRSSQDFDTQGSEAKSDLALTSDHTRSDEGSVESKLTGVGDGDRMSLTSDELKREIANAQKLEKERKKKLANKRADTYAALAQSLAMDTSNSSTGSIGSTDSDTTSTMSAGSDLDSVPPLDDLGLSLKPKTDISTFVEPVALGTRNEGFRCDFCGRALLAMNTLHTDTYNLDSSDSGSGEVDIESIGDKKSRKPKSERHEGVRLCGECSVGHCPECGTQLVPHLPVGVIAPEAPESKPGERTVKWYLAHSNLVVKCPNGDHKKIMKKVGDGSTNVAQAGVPSEPSSPKLTKRQSNKAGKKRLSFVED